MRCYAIGQGAFKALSQQHIETQLIDDEINTKFQLFRQGQWANVTYYKFEIIHENLQNYDYVCYTDGDIVFEDAHFYQYCIDHIGQYDLLIQNDTMSDHDDSELCSGFMFIKSNVNTLKLFDPVYVKKNSNIHVGWDDQVYINTVKRELQFKMLPLKLFPNGQYYRHNYPTLKPLLIHFNYVVGHEKSYQMIRYNRCMSKALMLRFLPKAALSVPIRIAKTLKFKIKHKIDHLSIKFRNFSAV